MCQAWKEMLQEERDEGFAKGKDEGIDIGRAEGEERKTESFVKKLLDKHFSDEMITELVEISPEKLADVKLKLQMA